ncbi:MAG: hypothetical protein RBT81_06925, partial [Gammaproteobacteria bacterium]|nr:hypothetical protein [Gammaproteobacteria bacterium]
MIGTERSSKLQPRVRHAVTFAACAALLLPLSSESAVYNTSYSYDVPNGIVTRTDPNGTAIAYHYNAVDKLSTLVLDAGGTPSE